MYKMIIPFVDLKAQFLSLKSEIELALKKILDLSSFSLGKEVELFEKEFAKYCGTKYCIGLNSGTSALHLALLANQIGDGDEVITQPNTFFATCEAISYTGAKPVFVDVNPKDYTIDVSRIEQAITSKTKAILPVHLYGNSSDIEGLLKIVKKYNLILIEDTCQAHGVFYKNKKLGSFGKVGCFSFYPAKVLGACGEAGAVVTNNREIYEKIKMLRDHGQAKKYYHKIIGYNYRMDGFQGAILRVKLKKLDNWISQRRKRAKLYNQLLEKIAEVFPPSIDLESSNFQYYVIRCKNRDKLKDYLAENGVFTVIHYPIPIHLQKPYKFLGYKRGDFPIVEKFSKEILSLPMYPELTKRQIYFIVSLIKKFYSYGKSN